MSGEGHDYKLDISSLPREEPDDSGKPRDFIGVHFPVLRRVPANLQID